MKKIKLLIVPKFEVGTLNDGVLGEAELYYREYLAGGIEHTLSCGKTLYVKDEIAMVITGEGKVNTSMALTSALSDKEYDFSDAYIFSTGCAGGAFGNVIMGDLILVTSVCDNDLGHNVDSSELSDPAASGWFRDVTFDDYSCVSLDSDLMDKVFELIKDFSPATTDLTRKIMKKEFGDAPWVNRDPVVMKGTAVSGDNYWKGMRGHVNAYERSRSYGCPDPYAVTEMEEIAVARVAECFGKLDHLIILRDSVNMDVFLGGNTPESLWSKCEEFTSMVSKTNEETADIFVVSRHNNFQCGKMVIDAVLSEKL